MAVIGALGKTTFSISRKMIKTFDGLSWESGTNYATHNIHLQAPKIEFTNLSADTITFEMKFSIMLGLDPVKEINSLEKSRQQGEIMRLVIGNKVYGRKWVITKISKTLEKFDNKGNLISAKVNISLLAYK